MAQYIRFCGSRRCSTIFRFRNPSSQAPKLPSSDGDREFLGIASVLSASGFDDSIATPSIGKTASDASTHEVDAGVIFSDRSLGFCMPLRRFGLAGSNDIKSIVSSCECVKPSLVQCSDSLTTTDDCAAMTSCSSSFVPNYSLYISV